MDERLTLARALRVANQVYLALVGSGGKTTALFQLARELPGPVLVTASTHLGEWQLGFADQHWIITRPEDAARYAGQIEGVTLFTGPPGERGRMQGLDAASLAAVKELGDQLGFSVLIEADGSRQRPIKTPSDWEPVIPAWIDQVVVVAGLSGLDRPLDPEAAHRPELFGQLAGIEPGAPIDEEALSRVLTHPAGGLKGIPDHAHRRLLLNQADNEDLIKRGLRVANYVDRFFNSVIISSLQTKEVHAVVEPTAGIILAAGGSTRFGRPKMLLSWRGKALIRHVAETALAAGLSEVIVVVGAEDAAIRKALAGLPVRFAENPNWQQGQSTSVAAGIRAAGTDIGAAIFFLADQPLISAALVQRLVGEHQRSLAPVIAPRVGDRRANPVLFDRDTFGDLLQLTGDSGGRAIFERYGIEYVDWDDPNLLLDVDTEDDYRRLQDLE